MVLRLTLFSDLECLSYLNCINGRPFKFGFECLNVYNGLMNEQISQWNGDKVRKWLECRFNASLRDQDWADAHGQEREDAYDKAAAEEWVCRLTKSSETTNDQVRFAKMLATLLNRQEFRHVGVRDQQRFEKNVVSYIKKLLVMTDANAGFDNLARFQ